MSMLSAETLADIAGRLDRREQELRGEVDEARRRDADRPSAQGPQVDDRGEQGEQQIRRGIERVERLRDEDELSAIDEARRRLADGSYGQCTDCGKSIPAARLQVQPAAARCVACEATREHREGAAPRYSA